MKKLYNKYREIFTYLIAGVLATAISWGTYPLFKNVLNFNVFSSSLSSWICAFIFAFITNKLWVFESKSWEKKLAAREFLTFLSSRAFTGVLEVVSVPLFVKIGIDAFFINIIKLLHINIPVLFTQGMCSKIAISVIVVILNYVFSKIFVFKKPNTN